MAQPTTYTVTGPAAVQAFSLSDEFTVTIGSGDPLSSPVTITPTVGGVAGVSVPTKVVLDATHPSAKFRIVPTGYGPPLTLTLTNSASLSNPTISPSNTITTPQPTRDATVGVGWDAVVGADYYEVFLNNAYFARTQDLGFLVPVREMNSQIRVVAYKQSGGVAPGGGNPAYGTHHRTTLGQATFSVSLMPTLGGGKLVFA